MKDELITIRKSELINLCAVCKIETFETVAKIKLNKQQQLSIVDSMQRDINLLIESGDLQTINPN